MSELRRCVIGVDTGGTKIAAHISDGKVQSIIEMTRPTPTQAKPDALQTATNSGDAIIAGRTALLDSLTEICQALLTAASAEGIAISGIGIGTAGQVDTDNGVVVDANENLIGWKGTPVAKHLNTALNLPVWVDNDVRVMALAETHLGAAKDYQHTLCLTIGTGIGGAIVMDGNLWRGAHFSAGEIGYLYSRPAAQGWHNIEHDYSGPGIEREYQRATKNTERISLREIAAHAAAGDYHARMSIRNMAHGLGTKLAPVLAFLDPQAVVVGGGVPQIGDLWWRPFVAGIRDFHLESVQQMPIVPAALGPRAGMIGAATLALSKLQEADI